ncbi:sulfur carrier protein ThiS [Specibacter cremeus]|uniref:sulfur carrier protein ThiS n=1 Tax=Specibacter cremeus TaxID=1629051 RepID=UPI000F76B33C|nr:sulfur carrier protein ThiS [Specibacter cremeus]
MTQISLNGAAHSLTDGSTVADLVHTVTGRPINPDGRPADGGRLGVAVALNAGIVPRSLWAATPLSMNDDVEIVTAVQGG